MGCIKESCWSETEVSQFDMPVAMVSASAPLDCSATSCQPVCECASSKCKGQIDACLAHESCASLQACVNECKCGDHECTAGCAFKNPLALPWAAPLFACIKESCWSETEVSQFDMPVAMVSASAPLDCSVTSCQPVCECASSKCKDRIDACLAHESC